MGAIAEKLKPDEDFAWTNARIEFLKQRHGEGASANMIASELGHNVSRSAVLGKIFRLGLSKETRQKPTLTSTQNATPMLRPRAIERSKPTLKPAQAPVPIAPAVAALAEPPNGGIAIYELEANSCRWPVGTPGGDELMRYCGAGVSPEVRGINLCYCAAHMAVAYPPKEARKRP